jgi:branched-chain amino acid aminotransferase
MFVADYNGSEWVNMEIKPLSKLEVHPASMAWHYGQSIFEGMKATKTSNGTPVFFRPELHIERLNASARRMCMPEFPREAFIEAINKLVAIDSAWIPPQKGSALYIRPFMFATDEFIGVKASKTYKFIIFLLPVGPYYPKPVSLIAEKKYIRAAHGGVGEAKTAGNYAASLYPAQLANAKGYDQVMWLDAKEFSYVQEVGTMNIFFVFKDKIVTPATTGTILKGITRRSIIELLEEKGVIVEERPITIEEVIEAYKSGYLKEVFGSGTAAVIANIDKIKVDDIEMTFGESNWETSRAIKEEIDSMRFGTMEDKFGWIVPVKDTVLA